MTYQTHHLPYIQTARSNVSVTHAQLRKLPQLPEKTGKIDFEWPTPQQLHEMLDGRVIRMHRLDVWMASNGTLCGVRVTLTNGAQSPIFKSQKTH